MGEDRFSHFLPSLASVITFARDAGISMVVVENRFHLDEERRVQHKEYAHHDIKDHDGDVQYSRERRIEAGSDAESDESDTDNKRETDTDHMDIDHLVLRKEIRRQSLPSLALINEAPCEIDTNRDILRHPKDADPYFGFAYKPERCVVGRKRYMREEKANDTIEAKADDQRRKMDHHISFRHAPRVNKIDMREREQARLYVSHKKEDRVHQFERESSFDETIDSQRDIRERNHPPRETIAMQARIVARHRYSNHDNRHGHEYREQYVKRIRKHIQKRVQRYKKNCTYANFCTIS